MSSVIVIHSLNKFQTYLPDHASATQKAITDSKSRLRGNIVTLDKHRLALVFASLIIHSRPYKNLGLPAALVFSKRMCVFVCLFSERCTR